MEKAGYTITHQPASQAHMSSISPLPLPSSPLSSCCSKNKCHAHRLRTFIPALLALLALIAVAAWYLCPDMSEVALDVSSSLWKRQSASSGTSEDSPFVKNKLYLIVIFVGLLVCVILAIMLSVWCCRGAFENPLCCPCYLCACCGGLACLECIGCGLCCEGLDQLDV